MHDQDGDADRFVFPPAVAGMLGHAPPAVGWIVAALAAPAVFAPDRAEHAVRARLRRSQA